MHTKGILAPSMAGFATNDGAIPVIAEQPDGKRMRVCLVDCQAEFKRGKGYQAKCAERDANMARIILTWNSHDDLLAALKALVASVSDTKMLQAKEQWYAPELDQARAALAKAGG